MALAQLVSLNAITSRRSPLSLSHTHSLSRSAKHPDTPHRRVSILLVRCLGAALPPSSLPRPRTAPFRPPTTTTTTRTHPSSSYARTANFSFSTLYQTVETTSALVGLLLARLAAHARTALRSLASCHIGFRVITLPLASPRRHRAPSPTSAASLASPALRLVTRHVHCT